MSGGASYAVPVDRYGTDIERVGGIGAETGKVQEHVDADGKVRQYILVRAGGTIPWGEFCIPNDSGTDLLYEVVNASSAGIACVGASPPSSVAVGTDTGLSDGDYFWMQTFGEATMEAEAGTARGVYIGSSANGKVDDVATSGYNYVGWSITGVSDGLITVFLWPGIGAVL